MPNELEINDRVLVSHAYLKKYTSQALQDKYKEVKYVVVSYFCSDERFVELSIEGYIPMLSYTYPVDKCTKIVDMSTWSLKERMCSFLEAY